MISDLHISILTDVARSAGIDLSDDQRAALPEVLASGHLAPAQTASPPQRYRLTPAGQAVLDERGVGANES